MNEYIRICRIDHWLKNIFIVFGHAVAFVLGPGVDLNVGNILVCALSLVPACFIASANYILNEILDAPFDRTHPTKRLRGVAAGKVNVTILWGIKVILIILGFVIAFQFFDIGYIIALALLLLSGVVYNVQPLRLKDRAYLDVIAESFNNPIRLWLGWYALVPLHGYEADYRVPMTIVLAWWSFGALLMTGKRYAEFRFIDDPEVSGRYRKSFRTYNNQKLIIAMITYANLFCFCTGIAMATHPEFENLILVFPMIVIAIIAYFHYAMSDVGARLEPERLMRHPWIIASTIITALLALWLLSLDYSLVRALHIL
ncbi:MAG: UbiA family prenyltransferase [Verrucomicrobiae bacterium]|nr:UbiA family prenyltransferase [Verrucomicrobiae bacterium]